MTKSYRKPYSDVTLLTTVYNRSNSLQRLLHAFTSLGICFEKMIVSDDGSDQVQLEKIKKLQKEHGFCLITVSSNKGLGNNLNKGQDKVTTPYTLYVQEDFVPTEEFVTAFEDSLAFFKEDKELDIVRFFSNYQYPYTQPYKKGFSKITIPPIALDYRKIYAYSDTPHLRKSDFLQKFGRYAEGIKGDRTEYRMCISFLQKDGKALIYDKFKSLFLHENLSDEPSTMFRSKLTSKDHYLLSFLRSMYRQVRYNFDIFFSRY